MTTGHAAGDSLACGWCHMYWGGGNGVADGYTVTSSKVQVYSLTWNPNTQSPGDAATRAVVATHAISENTTTPVSDFAACFNCHGATSYNGSTQVVPFHGLGTPYLPSKDPGAPTVSPNANNQRNIFSGPTNLSGGTGSGLASDSRHPGWKALNGLGLWIPLQKTGPGNGATQIEGKAYYAGNVVAPKKLYDDDVATQNTPATSDYPARLDIPWDNFAGNPTLSVPQSLSNFDLGLQGVESGIPTTVPSIPVSLP